MDNGEALGEAWQYSKDYHQAANFLGVGIYDRNDSKVAQKISAISDWAAEKTGKKEPQAILSEVAKLQRSIGYSGIGKDLVNQLYENIRIQQDSRRIQKKVKRVDPIEKATTQLSSALGKTLKEMLQGLVKTQMKGAR